ncbi:hypothetical protein [Nisaea sediminum]|uniref:hypothetical protein n=1 Tax=Nisaea sediminum TaxID=2775867 RepID=UPI001867277C|nr:hypothetical protein [Nisaea sediminum]
MPGFRQHGEYRLECDGYILKLDASGQVNQETIAAYARDVLDRIRSFEGEPFAIYSAYDPQVLLTHDAEATLRNNIGARIAAGMCAAALNLSQSDYRLTVAGQIGGLYDEFGLPWREFESYEEAKPWLEDQISQASSKRAKS